MSHTPTNPAPSKPPLKNAQGAGNFDAKFGSLVHRFGMISVGLHARDFFEIDFWPFLDPQNRGYFEGGAGISAQI